MTNIVDKNNYRRLSFIDFDKSCIDLAVFLLGKILVRKLNDGCLLKGKIVETECYPGGEDKASHSFGGKRTERNEPMYMAPGTTYVYMLYYGYHCLNISSKEPGGVVLIRALEPDFGEDVMRMLRDNNSRNKTKKVVNASKLCDGPAKLCMSFNLTKNNANKINLSDPVNEELWIEDCRVQGESIRVISCRRIGLGKSAEEWADANFRFYIFKNGSVSKIDREAENKAIYIDCKNSNM